MALTLDWSLLKLGIVEQNPNSPIFSFCDARNLDEILTYKIVDVTITSPPYFDLKDYGHKNQIGFSQDYGEYLNNLEAVFEKVYNVTKDTGSPGWLLMYSGKTKKWCSFTWDCGSKNSPPCPCCIHLWWWNADIWSKIFCLWSLLSPTNHLIFSSGIVLFESSN